MFTPRGTELTHDFYDLLFARYPGVRVMFPTDMKAQEKKLFDSLTMVVNNLDDTAAVRQRLVELGQRHEQYGAKPEHYPLICSLLLETMAKTAGLAWTPELAAEWSQALQLVSETMLQGGRTGPRAHAAPDQGRTR